MEALVLLGWMKAETAVTFLREQCMFGPPLSERAAADVWRRHREHVERLGPRSLQPPELPPFTEDEKIAVGWFVNDRQPGDAAARDVVKLNPLRLAVRQLGVAADRCFHFAKHCHTRAQWIEQWLTPPPAPIGGQVVADLNAVDIHVPHPEFLLAFDSTHGFKVIEGPRHIAVECRGDTAQLVAGHHRVYAYLASRSGQCDPSVIAVQQRPADEADTIKVLDGEDSLCRTTPPIVADFFDDRLALCVKMRPRRFELQVRARIAVVPVPERAAAVTPSG